MIYGDEDILGVEPVRCACRAVATRVYPGTDRPACATCVVDLEERKALAVARIERMIAAEERACRVGSLLIFLEAQSGPVE